MPLHSIYYDFNDVLFGKKNLKLQLTPNYYLFISALTYALTH